MVKRDHFFQQWFVAQIEIGIIDKVTQEGAIFIEQRIMPML